MFLHTKHYQSLKRNLAFKETDRHPREIITLPPKSSFVPQYIYKIYSFTNIDDDYIFNLIAGCR